jgi:hypothetical protein
VRKTVDGSPFLQDNGKCLTLKFTLPLSSVGLVGMEILKKKCKNVFDKTKDKKNDTKAANILGDFAEMGKFFAVDGAKAGISAVQHSIEASESKIPLGLSLKNPLGISFSGSSDFTFVWTYVPSINTLSSKPLPTQTKVLENRKGRWVLDFATITSSVNTSSSIPIPLKLSTSVGKLSKRTGTNTFHDLFSKFNALSLGKADSKSNATTAIDSLLSGQSGQMLKIFQNVGKMENAAFELQTLYNDLLQSISSESEKKKCETLFKNFIEACIALDDSKNDKHGCFGESETDKSTSIDGEIEQLTNGDSKEKDQKELKNAKFKKAFDLFRDIAELQYTYSFKPYYDSAFK